MCVCVFECVVALKFLPYSSVAAVKIEHYLTHIHPDTRTWVVPIETQIRVRE